jgi:thiamine kinase-like enzyme
MTVRSAPVARPDGLPVAGAADERVTAALTALLGERGWTAVEPLPGGLTNEIRKVTLADGKAAVLRIPTASNAILGIGSAAELSSARAAAQARVAPDVLAEAPSGASLVAWVDGRTLAAADLDDSAMLQRVAQMCRTLHAGPRFANDFDMFAVQSRYLAAAQARQVRLPVDYLDHAASAVQIRAALAVTPEPTRPCHNDLLPANILDDGRLWFIDWEYSGNNEAAFELGNLWAEADLPEERLAELVAAYTGRPDPRVTARARLLAAVGQYGWALWGCIQSAVSDVDFDFDFNAWGRDRYDRAVALFRAPRLASLLDTAAQVA